MFCSSNAVDFPKNVEVVSLAKSLILKLFAESRLLMYIRNNNGPSMDPCCTLLVIGFLIRLGIMNYCILIYVA